VAGAARLVDIQFQTSDRISSAYDILKTAARQQRPLTVMEEALTRDAASCLSRIELKKVRLPFWWKWGTWVTAAAVIVACGLGIAAFNWRYGIQSIAAQALVDAGNRFATVSRWFVPGSLAAVPSTRYPTGTPPFEISMATLAVEEQVRLLAARGDVSASLKTLGAAVSAAAMTTPAQSGAHVLLTQAAGKLDQAAADPSVRNAKITSASADIKATAAALGEGHGGPFLVGIAKPLQDVAARLDAAVAADNPSNTLASLKQAGTDLQRLAQVLRGNDSRDVPDQTFFAAAPFAPLSSNLKYSGEILDIPAVDAGVIAASGNVRELAVVPERIPGDPTIARRYFSLLREDSSLPNWTTAASGSGPAPTPSPPATPSPAPVPGLTCPAVTAHR